MGFNGGGVIEKAKNMATVAASLATTAMLARSIINDYLPEQMRTSINSKISWLFNTRRSPDHMTIVVQEYEGLRKNELYQDAAIYLGGMRSPTTRRLRVRKQINDERLTVEVDEGEEVVDVFQGVELRWLLASRLEEDLVGHRGGTNTGRPELVSKMLELSFHRKHMDLVFAWYLPHVMERSKAIQEGEKPIKLHMHDGYEGWVAVRLDHPATFETVALDPETKQMLVSDLDAFVGRKEYYRRIGKPWKRGYLLYGPPGTGKSSLVVAMANYLKFDIYDLELASIQDNSSLRSTLLTTSNRSIIVVEDIDCSIDITANRELTDDKSTSDRVSVDRGSKVTLSGLLNAIDGLWSSCGDERIIVFTTNHKNKLDPALLRPGRMDLHIHLSYCTVPMLRVLMGNYHSVDHHPLFSEIDRLIADVEVTPAEAVGELMRSDDVDVALGYLRTLLLEKKQKQEQQEA